MTLVQALAESASRASGLVLWPIQDISGPVYYRYFMKWWALIPSIVLLGCTRPYADVTVVEQPNGHLSIGVSLGRGRTTCVESIEIAHRERTRSGRRFTGRWAADWIVTRLPNARCRSDFEFPLVPPGYALDGRPMLGAQLRFNEEYVVDAFGADFQGEARFSRRSR